MEAVKSKDTNIFISANAGSGKTTQLICRFISLILSGTEVDKILCITYTEKAAEEMQNRIVSKLNEIMENINKESGMEIKIYGDQFNKEYAKNRVEKTLINFNQCQISTLHGFLLKIIKKNSDLFNVNDSFGILPTDDFDEKVRLNFIKKTLLKTTKHQNQIKILIKEFSKKTFDGILQDGIEKVEVFSQIIKHKNEFLSIYNNLLNDIGRSRSDCISLAVFDEEFIDEISKSLRGYNDDFEVFKKERSWSSFVKMCQIFLTSSLTSIRVKLTLDQRIVAEKITKKLSQIFTSHSAYLTELFLAIEEDILKIYEDFKTSQNSLDYTDMVEKVRMELENEESIVFFQILESVDHLMLDEAQDTSSSQWEIIDKIFMSFMRNISEKTRTIFIVGDEKQSIYSFNGANVKQFSESDKKYKEICEIYGQKFEKISLENSYRSSKKIIDFVNNFTKLDIISKASNISKSNHICTKETEGAVECVFFKQNNNMDDDEKWKAIDQMCEKILDINQKGETFSNILILTRQRGTGYWKIIEKMRNLSIPFSSDLESGNRIMRCFWDIIAIARVSFREISKYELSGLLKSCIFDLNDFDLLEMKKNKEEISINSLEKDERFKKTFEDIFSIFDDNFQTYIIKLISKKEISNKIKSEYGEDIFVKVCKYLTEKSENMSLISAVSKFSRISEIKINSEIENAVRIMTIHSAKGLDENTVFVFEERFDMKKVYKSMEEKQGKLLITKPDYKFFTIKSSFFKAGESFDNFVSDIKNQNEKFNLSEYMRIFYVGITRPKNNLFMYLKETDESGDIQKLLN